ncbi:hypothetical protein L7F22_006414 [Adiantum nelumboides]|nr:hypothetical protein [Adiantum nelumboides]
MDLLARLVENSRAIAHLNLEDNIEQSRSVSDLVPRLFPFFRHTITSVRLSVLNALSVFLSVPSLSRDWIDARVLRLLFQNLIVEERLPIREASKKAWSKASTIVVEAGGPARLVDLVRPHLSSFFIILMTPLGSPLDFSLFYKASTSAGMGGGDAHNVDKGILAQDLSLVGVDTVIRGRLGAAEALGSIMAHWPRDLDDEAFHDSLVRYISSSSALQKCLASTVVQEWSESATKIEVNILEASPISRSVGAKLISILESPPPDTYAEMAVMLQRIQTGCQGLYTAFQRDAKVAKTKIPILPSKVDPLGRSADGFTVETAKDVVGKGFDALLGLVSAKTRKTAQAALDERRRKLIADLGFYQATKSKQDTQVAACAAAAVIGLKLMPSKLNPVIRSIMTSVKFEDNYDLQQRSARAVASFIGFCSSPAATANPSDKIIKNLCAFVCQDTTQTPIYANAKDQLEGILSINEVPPVAPKWKGRGGGPVSQADANEPEEVREGKLIRRGAEMTLREVSRLFGDRLFHVVPTLWDCMSAPLLDAFGKSTDVKETQGLDVKDDGQGQTVIDCCTLLQANLANLDASLHQEALVLLPALTSAIKCKRAVVRTAASKAISTMAECITEATMMHIVNDVVALLGDASNVCNRQGAIEAISHVVQLLDLKLLPYVIVLIVPILGRMSDSDDAIRLVATNTFASLVKMVPLETGLPDPPGFSQELLARREEERKFLSQLLDGTKVEPYTIPVKVNAELRKYQQDGVNWMAFLAKFQLHGVLCDDMGLGKTLQSICILAGKHYERAQRYEATKALDTTPLPSLIVCPPTLTGHWCHEIRQYSTNLRPLLYAGLPQERARLQGQIPEHDCVVMSYDTVRNDIAVLSQINWLYCVLDEGHIIKSAKTKTTKAIKMIKSQHRLILSGTPIQNNVLELWSLFDFLMPGFLGTERAFHERFGKPILASRDGKVTAKEHERASLALDALHKQVLPFLLRRMKEDVLNDLPPKIIQDIECDLGDVQRQLYDEFSRTQDRNAIEGAFEGDTAAAGDPSKKHHVFQTLQYLRKLVNHPLLVFDRANKKHVDVERQLIKSGSSLRDVANAPKLLALRQLLNDCGIGESGSGAASGTGGGISTAASEGAGPISQHRVLIFCQLKQMLDIIESDLFKTLMPSVSYMRLDGGVSADKRHGIVQRFNSDPSIDVLLLTTQVGGLGLTLTGADTVIFVEHDWNPMKDMQAMDRAHRLGQKKVVNVYRLITRNTLEARIMGLQRFKLNVANSVVTQQNAGLESMDTDQILDLFDPTSDTAQKGGEETDQKKKKGGISQKALLASIEAMPDTGDDYADMATWQA